MDLFNIEWKQLSEETKGSVSFTAIAFVCLLAIIGAGAGGVLLTSGNLIVAAFAGVLAVVSFLVYAYSIFNLWRAISREPLSDSERGGMHLTLILLGPVAFIVAAFLPDKASLESGRSFTRWAPVAMLAGAAVLTGLTVHGITARGSFSPIMVLLAPVFATMGLLGIVDPETFWANHSKRKGLAVSPRRLAVVNGVGFIGLLLGAVALYRLFQGRS